MSFIHYYLKYRYEIDYICALVQLEIGMLFYWGLYQEVKSSGRGINDSYDAADEECMMDIPNNIYCKQSTEEMIDRALPKSTTDYTKG